MAKVTGKFQITLPKAIVDQCGVRVGDELEFSAAGRAIRVEIATAELSSSNNAEGRLRQFDAASARQHTREAKHRPPAANKRGWTREELYTRGRTG